MTIKSTLEMLNYYFLGPDLKLLRDHLPHFKMVYGFNRKKIKKKLPVNSLEHFLQLCTSETLHTQRKHIHKHGL